MANKRFTVIIAKGLYFQTEINNPQDFPVAINNSVFLKKKNRKITKKISLLETLIPCTMSKTRLKVPCEGKNGKFF
ncbi:MAG: hypothetical protein WCK32_00570 [Chlorobiaceae bacterium]